MSKNIKLLFASNDWRSKHLEEELRKILPRFEKVEYDPIPSFNKYLAAALTFHPNKSIWWTKYQWHWLVQEGRQKKLLSEIEKRKIDFNVFLMWGSWFNPFLDTKFQKTPFYYYIDQSCNKVVDDFDVLKDEVLNKPRLNFNRTQYLSYQQCKAVFCMSQWTKDQTLQSHTISQDKVIKVGWGPIGVNLIQEDVCFNEKDPTVLFIGNEFYRKGVDFIRRAIPNVVKEIPNVKFKIVGGNFDKLYVESHPNLELIGKITDVEIMKSLYRDASIFILPHRFERAGHVLIEAMSAGKPIITSNSGGPIDVVINDVNGYVINVGDVEALSKYLIDLLKDKNKRLNFGQNSRKIVVEGYTWDKIASKIVKNIEATM